MQKPTKSTLGNFCLRLNKKIQGRAKVQPSHTTISTACSTFVVFILFLVFKIWAHVYHALNGLNPWVAKPSSSTVYPTPINC